MRLAEGLVTDKEGTFGELKFSALRRKVYKGDENGAPTEEVERRTYDLRSSVQGMMIQVNVPANVEEKVFDYNARVDMINPVLSTISNATFRGADVDWYLEADDIILKKPEPNAHPAQPIKRDTGKEGSLNK